MPGTLLRAAALGLRDLHDMAGHIHCDMKTNNLLVSLFCREHSGFFKEGVIFGSSL
jgi:hypothetical protein